MPVIARAAIISLAGLAACGPMSPEAAQRVCADRARAAAGPTGTVGIGVGSGGVATDLEIGISSDFIRGRDPQAVYDDCMARRTQVGATVNVER
ncbi:hypothetical protein SAMN04488012_106100 [Palleronia salina]|uniref:Lipoprotein n=1 Tax=Palleronia salina TaxID=313368 RepID=A0A1M6HQF5_9RHOB|nr:hypothetical protein [Palleronia salina]SHJ24386.1 hypothetical protein SAMN04488012_106100 [Palleronia salina]